MATLASLLLAASSTCVAGASTAEGPVIRAQFTTAIQDQEPVDNLTELSTGAAEKIYCFTELTNLAGQIVTHSWEYKGEVVNKVQFHLDRQDSRIWSSRLLTPDRPGSWTVVIISATGKVLSERTLDYNLEEPTF